MCRLICFGLVFAMASDLSVSAQPPHKKFTNSLGMEFALVPKGKAWLGGSNGTEGTKEVNISQDFFLGVYEVTQEEWEKVMGKNPSHFSRGGKGAKAVKDIADTDLKRFPVENLSWEEAQAFVKLVNDKVKKDDGEAGWEYCLPTEEQWEYACRGGPMADKTESAFDFYIDKPASTLTKEQANFAGSGLMRTTKVGSYPPNRLGLYDMHGNVWQWCADLDNQGRVFRGGGWSHGPGSCRAASRSRVAPALRSFSVGLRVARVPSTSK